MNLKTSFFNKSVVKSDLKRFWWVGAISTLLIFLTFTFAFLSFAFEYSDARDVSYYFSNRGFDSVAFAFFVPVGLSALIFSYLNSSSAVSCLHGLPVKRSMFFASHFLSGAIILTLPIIVNAIILMLFRLYPAIGEAYALSELFVWIGVYFLFNMLIFSGSAAVEMLSGNSVAGIVFTYIFAVLPVGAEAFVQFFLEEHLYGYVSDGILSMSEKIYTSPLLLSESATKVIVYIVFMLVFIAAAFLLYRKRKLEYNSEIIAFPKLRPVFSYGVAICAGAIGYAYLSELLDSKNILLLIPFGVLGIIVAQMIIGKTLKPKKAFKPAIIFSLAIVAMQFAFQADITGYERRIPEINDVAKVAYNRDFNNISASDYIEKENNMVEIFYETPDLSLTEKKDIENVIRLHSHMVEERVDRVKDMWDVSVSLEYTLNNGKKLKREYYVSYDEHKEFLEPIVESENVRKQYFPVLNEGQKNYTYVSVGDRRMNGELVEFYKNQPELEEILTALKEDLKNTDYEEFARRSSNVTQINVKYTTPAKYADGEAVPTELLPDVHEYYYVRSDYKNTLAVLEKLGVFADLPKAEQIGAIGVSYQRKGEYSAVRPAMTGNEKYDYDSMKRYYDELIQDPEQIKQVYEYVSENVYERANCKDITLSFMLKDGGGFELNCDLDEEELPAILAR